MGRTTSMGIGSFSAQPSPSQGRTDQGPTVCLFTDSLQPSGVGEHMLALACELRSHYPIALVSPPAAQRLHQRARALGFETLALEVRSAEAADELSRWLRARRVQIFHDHAGIGWEGHAGVYAARHAGVAAVVRTEHLPYLLTDPVQRRAHRRVIENVDRLICVSRAAHEGFVAAGIPAKTMRVVRNGILVRLPDADRLEVRHRLGVPVDACIVLTVARFEPQKGYGHLLGAVAHVLAANPSTHFVWVGNGSRHSELCERVRAQGLDAHVHLVGHRDDVPELMRAADLLVLPSLFEGLPLVVLEAMAAGLPVVATRVSGTTEALEDGVSGRLVAPADSAALALGVLEAIERPPLVAGWAKAAQERVEREFSAARMAREVANIYAEALASARTSGQLLTRA
ncbi:MAG: glycosyltransferase family 4 protein [Chloroflexi bacterium]|nr:glycosyltransferase family 4 protein [Chloroflexota bacterium]